MGKFWCLILVLVVFAFLHANARNLPSDDDHAGGVTDHQQTVLKNNDAVAPAAESPAGTGLKDKKNFIYGGVGGFAGMGGYAGMVGGLPLIGGVGGIGKYGGIGGVAGVGGGLGGAGGGLGGLGGLGGGLGGGAGGGAAGGAAGGAGGGILPCP
ncbi:glycine-rich protein 23 [Mercurialis annua]|uniref:glycine-rich protein 23 n=1 Tax=Mercurialis annua TaxID=3986 RepID=UPI0021604D0D|nr:glycine-rich protein 23 [Mercurialis annua]